MRAAVSVFVVLNLLTVVWMNVPAARRPAPRVHRAVAAYAHRAGLDTRWIMFGRLPRPQWRFLIKGRYAGGAEVALPIPLQGERSFLQRHFFDFKDVKIHTNFFNVKTWRRNYARYLAREFPRHDGQEIEAVVYELWIQEIVGPREAAERGTHRDGEPRRVRREEFRVP